MSKSKRTNIPNVISGGIATPLGNNMYLMIGRTHEQGGIDIGNTKRGLEVENGEVLKTNKKSVKVFSAKPILNGNSPAELVIKGINPEDVFNAQEKFKDENHLKDDGTSARLGRFSRVKQNDSPTKEISSGYEDYVNKTISKHGSLSNSKKYYIPYLYDKEIKVSGAGRMSSNMLDSIAVNANKAKIPFNEALGLAIQETHGGAMPTIAVPAGMDKDKVRAHFNMSYARNYGGIPAEYLINDYEYHNKGYKGSKNNDLTNIESPLQHGFTMYKRGLYNPGDKNHSNDVRAAGNKAVSSPDVQKWIQENGKKYNIKRMGGLNRKQDYGSKRKPYPTVSSSDFAGGNRSYPIPTKADAIDALKLAGLHGRNDVKAKVYAKYPSLKKAPFGTKYPYKNDILIGVNTDNLTTQYSIVGGNTIKPTGSIIVPQNQSNIIRFNEYNAGNTAKDTITIGKVKTNNPSTGRQPKAGSGFSIGSDLIRGAADLAGSIISYKINKDMIDKMKINNYVPYQRYKLKTNYNINPQLDSSREQINSMIDESKHNTASSRIDLARRQRYRNLGIRNTNEIYGQKENIETQLINQDILNAQRISQQNTQLVNDYLRRKAEMDNKLAELNAENKVSLAQNAAGVVGDYFDRRETRNREALDRAVIAASNPNAISYMGNELPKLARQFGYRPLIFNFGRFRKNK